MDFIEYPKWLHRDGKPSVLVENADAEAEQRAKWGAAQSPASKPANALMSVQEHGSEQDATDLRAAYKAKFGKKPYGGWDAETLKAKLEAE